jgi:SAM-dependent methyltransferase
MVQPQLWQQPDNNAQSKKLEVVLQEARFASALTVCLCRSTIIHVRQGQLSYTLQESLDLAMSLGVLHHIPDTGLAIKDVSLRIKPGGMFLCYLYYNMENKPFFYRLIFKAANVVRQIVSVLPQRIKRIVCSSIAALIYWPLAKFSKALSKIGINNSNIPLHHYAEMPFVMLANDALDRFGTTLEQRFSRAEITQMLSAAGFDVSTLKFSNIEPYWTFSVKKY